MKIEEQKVDLSEILKLQRQQHEENKDKVKKSGSLSGTMRH